MKKRFLLIIFIILLIGVGLFVYFGQKKTQDGELYYSGTIEATQANLGFLVTGRVLKITCDEGRFVEQGQILAILDPSEFQSRLEQTKANLDGALKAKEQLETLLHIMEKTLPEDVDRAKANVEIARSVLDDARKNNQRYEALFTDRVISEKERDTVKLAYENARSSLKQAEAVLKQSQINLLKIDSTRQDIESATTRIASVQASYDQAKIQLGYTRLVAPFPGVITSRNLEPGEVVTPGREVITLSDLSSVDLNIFVGETEIGKVKPGQDAMVKVDTFPQKTFAGKIAYISPEAEFTPKIIQTQKERVKLVFRVKITIPNPEMALKTGMPADAFLR